MNVFTIIILAALLVDYLLDLVAKILNLKALSEQLPNEFEGVYDSETYKNSQDYTRVTTSFGLKVTLFDLLLLLAFWFSGGFNWLDEVVREWGFSELVTGLCYIGLIVVAKSMLSIPFSAYSTFVIEERFGFNKTTPKTFLLDLLKSLLLSALLGIPLLAGILAFFMYSGEWAWLYAWIAVTLFTLILQYVAPTWIMPLFNKFTPLDEGDLKTAIDDYATEVDFPMKGTFVIDGSKRSSKSNAFFTGFGKNKRIALYDTLIENHTTDELVSVLAHEVGHYKKKHILKSMIIGVVHTGVLFFLLSIFLNSEGLFEAFFMQNMSVYAGLIFFGMLYAPVEMILSIFMQMSSRKHEYEADEYAVTTTGRTDSMISALKKLSKDNLSNLTPHPFYVFLNYSHPPILLRIEAIRRLHGN
ncbi:MAG: M48 family peptidase [Balneola sp.]|nr:MAG: M48 family peptidase [Balneola sp.]